jgi:hypothetical protein
MDVIRLLAVGTSSKSRGRGDPYDDTSRYELEHAVPCALRIVR